MFNIGFTVLALVLLIVTSSMASTSAENNLATADLEEIDRSLNNPLSNLWSMTLQNNTGVHEGSLLSGPETSNALLFQPFLPLKLGAQEQTMLTLRPVFPLNTQPVFDSADPMQSSGHKSGLGDIQLLAMSIGMGPTIVVDWEAESKNRLTFPVGLGVTKTIRWNKTPIKLRVESHYSLIKPDDFGAKWNFRLQITPVIANPFK